MEQFDLIQGPVVNNFKFNIGTGAVAAGAIWSTFIAVLVFKGITIVVTNNVIIVIIIIGFDGKDMKRRIRKF
jgi:hypothetical protein